MSATQTIPVRIAPDLAGVAVSSDSQTLVFYAPKAFPPGQPIELTLWPDTPDALTLQGRSQSSRLCPDQRFEVRVRLVNLARDARNKLRTIFGAG